MANNNIVEQAYVYGGTKQIIQAYLDSANSTKYYCDTDSGVGLAENRWRVAKVVYNNTTFDELLSKRVANFGSYDQPATDLATVQGLSYS